MIVIEAEPLALGPPATITSFWTQSSTTVFALAPEGAGTRVTWAMSGENGFVGKAMSLFMDLDTMVGPDFEKGRAALQALAEAEAARAPAASAR